MESQFIHSLQDFERVTKIPAGDIQAVHARFPLHVSTYYASLIDWADPHDPLRKIVAPDMSELATEGSVDPSREGSYSPVPGLQHKYRSVAAILLSNSCAGACRFCFRKRLFLTGRSAPCATLPEMVGYVAKHAEISEVLITGGDSLMLPHTDLREILEAFSQVDHVRCVRLGTKVPAFLPQRILETPGLLDVLSHYAGRRFSISVVCHFNHPRELTDEADHALRLLRHTGATLLNQTPILRGVNDSVAVLAELFKKTSRLGVAPYYVFQCRPTIGNDSFLLPIESAYALFEAAKSTCSGLERRARYVMSHSAGKLEIVAITDDAMLFKFHRAACYDDTGRIVAVPRDPHARWLDDQMRPSCIAAKRGDVA